MFTLLFDRTCLFMQAEKNIQPRNVRSQSSTTVYSQNTVGRKLVVAKPLAIFRRRQDGENLVRGFELHRISPSIPLDCFFIQIAVQGCTFDSYCMSCSSTIQEESLGLKIYSSVLNYSRQRAIYQLQRSVFESCVFVFIILLFHFYEAT